jgi:hypothetical protein
MQALRAIRNMTTNDVDNQLRFGALPACTTFVVAALKVHMASAPVAEQGLEAVYHLAFENQVNMSNLDDAGACVAVMAALSTHKVVAGILISGCRAVCALADNFSCLSRFFHLGAFSQIQEIMVSEKSGRDARLWSARALEAMSRARARKGSLDGHARSQRYNDETLSVCTGSVDNWSLSMNTNSSL